MCWSIPSYLKLWVHWNWIESKDNESSKQNFCLKLSIDKANVLLTVSPLSAGNCVRIGHGMQGERKQHYGLKEGACLLIGIQSLIGRTQFTNYTILQSVQFYSNKLFSNNLKDCEFSLTFIANSLGMTFLAWCSVNFTGGISIQSSFTSTCVQDGILQRDISAKRNQRL